MTDRELMQMAFDALMMCNAETMYASQRAAMAKLGERLSQPEPEPVEQCSYPKCQATNGCVGACSKTNLQKPIGQVEEDRFGKLTMLYVNWFSDPPHAGTLLYTAPPKREWVGLTDEEWIKELGVIREQISGDVFGSFYRAIEAKLKEKNT